VDNDYQGVILTTDYAPPGDGPHVSLSEALSAAAPVLAALIAALEAASHDAAEAA
jgi:hypothetical protein